MNVDFTPEQQSFVRQAIESGRIHRPEEAAQEAFDLWVQREKTKPAKFGQRVFDQAQAEAAAARMRKRREKHILPPGVTIRDLINAGRD